MKTLDYILKGFFFVFSGFVFTKILGYVYSVIVARLGAVNYGIFNLVNIALEIFLMISLIGLNEGIVRYISFYQGKKDNVMLNRTLSTAIVVPFAISILMTVAVFLSSDYIATAFFHNKDFGIVLKYTILVLPLLTIYRIMVPTLRGFKAIKYWMYSNDIWKSLSQFIIGAFLIYLGFGLFGAIAGVVGSILVSLGFAFYYLRKMFKFRIVAAIDKEIMIFSYPLLFTNVLILIKDWLSTLLIGYFIGVESVGVYSVAVLTARLLTIIPAALTSLFLPVITEKYADNKNIRDEYYTTTKWVFAGNLFLALMMIFLSKHIIILSFGHSYYPAAIPLIILSVGYFIENTFLTSKFILYMLKRTKLVFMMLFLTSIGNVVLGVTLIPKYGINGAAIATALSMAALGFLYLIYSHKHTRIKLFDAYHIKILLAGAASILISHLTGIFIGAKLTLFYLILLALEFFLIYAALILILKVFTNKEIKLFKNFIGLKV